MASNYSPLYDAKLWALRADEARVIAENMRDPEAKAMMATVIETCDQLAQRAAVLRDLLHPPPRDTHPLPLTASPPASPYPRRQVAG
jgi:hypothetical protein